MFNNPEGHPVRGRRRLGDLLHGPHPAELCRARRCACWSRWGWRSGWRSGCGSADCCSCAISGCCSPCRRVWQAMAARRLAPGDQRRADEPLARAAAGRRRRICGHAGVLALGAARPDRATRCARLPSSRTRPSRSTRCSTAGSCPASDLPWEYLPTYIRHGAARARPGAAARAAAPVAAIGLTRTRSAWARRETVARALFLLGFTIVFPVAYAIAIKAVLFDGMRHFIFVPAADRASPRRSSRIAR